METDTYYINGLRRQTSAEYARQYLRTDIMPSSATAPTDPVVGQVYFDTVSVHFFGYNGTNWVQLD